MSSDTKTSYGIRDQQKFFYLTQNTEDESEYVEVSNDVELKWAAYLLDVDMCSFAPCFTHKFTKTDEAVNKTPYSMGQALDARDALAMSLYEVVFSWILNRISLHLKCSDHSAVISVVDYYGIERYNNNGLEQLLINSVNEKLENTFVKQTFLDEIADYADEGLTFEWKMPPSLDNEVVLDLLCKKPYGLLYLIDDECKFPKVISMLFRPIAAGKEGADYVVYAAQQFNTASTALVEKILGYRCLLPSDIALCQKQKEIIIDILDGQGVKFADDHRIGANYVFMRDRLANRLQTLREKTQRDAAYVIQKTMRAYVARKGYLRKRQAIIRLQAALRGWKARKECCALREQMFKNISVQTKRNRRLNAYHETLLTDVSEKKCPTALLGCLNMENNVSKEIGKSLYEPKPKAPDMKITTEYLPMSLKSRIHTIEPVTIEKFAEENFRGHLLEPRREPILTPFLHKENDIDFRLSIEVFKLILKYMNDHTLNRNQLDDLARYIVKQGITNPCQRDEILVQICNQMYKNPDKEASSRCCRLLLQAVGVFSPTETVLPMLIRYLFCLHPCYSYPDNLLLSFANQQKVPLQTQLLNTIARRMNLFENQVSTPMRLYEKIPHHATRLLPASRLEMGALYGFHNAAVEVATQEGDVHVVEAHPWITSEELANRVLRHRGIGNPSGWTVEVETEKMLYCPTGAHFLHDVISEIELGKEENKRSPVVKRRMRQANDSRDSHHRDRSADAINGRMSRGESRRGRSHESLHVTNVTASPPSYRQTYRDVGEEEAEYCYALPVKPKSLDDSIPRSPRVSYAVPRAERSDDTPPELPRQPIPSGSASRFEPLPFRPPHPHHRLTDSHDRTIERPESMVSNPYYAQTTIPMVQYVPVVMAPQGIPMFPNQMGQPLVQPQVLMPTTSIANPTPSQPPRAFDDTARQDRIASQLSHHREPSSQSFGRSDPEDRSREYGTMKSIPRVDFDSVRSRSSAATKGGDCDSRMLNSRCDQVPSVYSTMSVASRIRNMPVPNNNHDVDRFLDEVFDQVGPVEQFMDIGVVTDSCVQVLSPHELATAEMNSHQIAASIKGGVYGPVDYETPYQREPPPYPPNFSGNGYHQNGMDSGRYEYTSRENLEDSSDSFASDICTMREYIPSAQGTPNVQRAARPYEGAGKSANGIYEPQQQMVFMMPMQMNGSFVDVDVHELRDFSHF
ncbi:myTH4 domain protein [Ancylostoma ceylanicum]|uniref:MyTH4 domain protein n=1 Tax=Ancylostoma ceylanicum TaxID=53326 RepID=A0A0D6MCH7_9BILA|nr:myTH4 domain protein [Ancylostoma ceylanicum]